MNLALFDLDGTLLPTDSDHAFGEFMVALGWADGAASRARNDAFYADYVAGKLDVHEYLDFATSAWRDRAPHEAEAARQRFMREVIAPSLRPAAQRLVEQHRAAGETAVIRPAAAAELDGELRVRRGKHARQVRFAELVARDARLQLR